jgi:hypothetical protein
MAGRVRQGHVGESFRRTLREVCEVKGTGRGGPSLFAADAAWRRFSFPGGNAAHLDACGFFEKILKGKE